MAGNRQESCLFIYIYIWYWRLLTSWIWHHMVRYEFNENVHKYLSDYTAIRSQKINVSSNFHENLKPHITLDICIFLRHRECRHLSRRSKYWYLLRRDHSHTQYLTSSHTAYLTPCYQMSLGWCGGSPWARTGWVWISVAHEQSVCQLLILADQGTGVGPSQIFSVIL